MNQWRMGRRLTVAVSLSAASAAALGMLAGCGSSAGQAAGGAASGATAAAPGAPFTQVIEPFDPGHAARAMSSPASCGGQDTTLAIEQCYDAKTETADAAIDAVQQGRYTSAPVDQQGAINADDSGWFATRRTVCAKAYQTGGTIDGINIAGCLLDESTARLDALKGITPPEAALKSTDSTSLSDVSWYTTPKGSRIGLIDTQGDATGGAVIAWVIIAGADGFVVNPAQFYYHDGSFTDTGTVQAPDPSDHEVAAGAEYQFSIDYSHLSADPNTGQGSGGWVYAPGSPVAVWHYRA